MRRGVEAIWNGSAAWTVAARAILAPVSLAFRGVTVVRNALYDRRLLPVHDLGIPVVSIGNLSVGGTGKTPVAAWFASAFRDRGARPAIVMRGYGDDEPLVHATLNPSVPVVANVDRAAAVREAVRKGCDIAILDDGFQHRRLGRNEDVVLVSADRWRGHVRLLPAGPWRELPSALKRASLVIVTRKAASRDSAHALMRELAGLTRTGRGAVASLSVGDLRNVQTGERRPLSVLHGSRVLVVAGIADPESLAAQLGHAGARVDMRSFPDHHAFDSSDITGLAHDARAFDHALCTLKDAVKLGQRWPREGTPLWYVSLRCDIEVGDADVSALLDRVFAARPAPDQQALNDRRLNDSLPS